MKPALRLEPIDRTRRDTGPLPLDSLPCVIGRDQGCGLRLNLDRISRRHLRLESDHGRLVVHDLGSTNGTFVNERRVSGPTPLAPGDTLHIADYGFRLESGETDAIETPVQPNGPDAAAGHTIAGYTGEPAGFPVQAPQFYELLNEALIDPVAIPGRLVDASGQVLLIGANSTHPALKTRHDKLVDIARQLGEEARFHELLRERAVETASTGQLDHLPLALPFDPIETEDMDLLLDQLGSLSENHRRLELACRTNPAEIDAASLARLARALERMDIRLAIAQEDFGEELQQALAGVAILVFEAPDADSEKPLSEFD